MPVAITTALPVPEATLVPEKIRFGISRRWSISSSTGSAIFRTGTDSPVRIELFVLSSNSSMSLPSAETISPSSKTRRSPGTRSLAGICTISPSLTTLALGAISRFNASVARSALNSCQKLKMALITITAKIAQPSSGISATKERMPPTQRRRAKRWMN